MSIVIRDVREHELDSVLALNNNAGLAILPLDAERLRLFYAHFDLRRDQRPSQELLIDARTQ
jgi:predicted GNAT superfamily acetyltransferase